MKRADKIRLAALAAKEAEEASPRSKEEREAARREWADIRKAAREAYLANKDWAGILNSYRERDGFYSAMERERMCKDFTNELIMRAPK